MIKTKATIITAVATVLTLAGLLSPPVAAAEREPLLVAGDEGRVILRWAWPEGTLAAPSYRVYRTTAAAASWELLTPEPITKVRDRTQARKILGAERFEKFEALLFPAIPGPQEDPAKFREALLHMRQLWAMTMLTADMHPDLAELLGVRFEDDTVMAGRRYRYRLAIVDEGGERVVATSPPVEALPPEIRPPGGFEGEAGDGVVMLRWNADPRFSAYDVYRHEGSSKGTFTQINREPIVVVRTTDAQGNQRRPEWLYADQGAANGRRYWYTVRGRDPFGRLSPLAEPIELVPTDMTAPLPPTGFSTAVSETNVTLTWEPSADEDAARYHIYRGERHDADFEKIATVTSSRAPSYVDAGRQLGRAYWYYATAVDSSGNESGPSYVALANVVDRIPPTRPAGLEGTTEPGKVLLSWTPGAEPDLAGYRVYRALRGDAEKYLLLNQTPRPEARLVHELPPTASAAPFFFKVTAVDEAGNESEPSDVVEARLPDVTPPAAPVFRAFRVDEGVITLTWYPSLHPDIAGYNLYRRSEAAAEPEPRRLNEAPLPPEASSYSDRADLVPGVTYRYVLEAFDASGNVSRRSSPMNAATFDATPPSAPGDLAAEPLEDGQGVRLSWTLPADKDLQGVILYRGKRIEGPYYPLTPVILETSFVDEGSRSGKTYYYALVALDRSNNRSSRSDPVAATVRPE